MNMLCKYDRKIITDISNKPSLLLIQDLLQTIVLVEMTHQMICSLDNCCKELSSKTIPIRERKREREIEVTNLCISLLITSCVCSNSG